MGRSCLSTVGLQPGDASGNVEGHTSWIHRDKLVHEFSVNEKQMAIIHAQSLWIFGLSKIFQICSYGLISNNIGGTEVDNYRDLSIVICFIDLMCNI